MHVVNEFRDICFVKDGSLVKAFVDTVPHMQTFKARVIWDGEAEAYHLKLAKLGGPFQWEYWLDHNTRLFVVKEPED